MGNRAQTYTLEGIIASLVVLAGIFFALQATTAAPQSAGVTNPHAEQQDRTIARDVVTIADQEELTQAVLFWDDGAEEFHCTPSDREYYPGRASVGDSGEVCDTDSDPHPPAEYEDDVPPNEFGHLLERHLGAGYSYNVIVAYNDSGTRATQRMVYQGEPADGAVRAVTSVAISDDQHLYDSAGNPTGPEVDPSNFYAPKSTSQDEIYAVLHVEVIVWRG